MSTAHTHMLIVWCLTRLGPLSAFTAQVVWRKPPYSLCSSPLLVDAQILLVDFTKYCSGQDLLKQDLCHLRNCGLRTSTPEALALDWTIARFQETKGSEFQVLAGFRYCDHRTERNTLLRDVTK